MKARGAITAATVCVACFAVFVAPASAADSDAVNRCYQELVAYLKSDEQKSPKVLVEIVQKDSNAARACLVKISARTKEPGKRGTAFGLLHDELEEAMLLAGQGENPKEAAAQRLLSKVAERRWTREDNLFVTEKVVQRFPKLPMAHHLLGALYLEQCRDGMAVEELKKGLAIQEDADSRKLLAIAEERLANYTRQPPLSGAAVHGIFIKRESMAPCPGLGRKVETDVSIQRRILFDEWSDRIKDQFSGELLEMGKALKAVLNANEGMGLLIEGHTDRRGSPEKNIQLSRERAESVKRFLVENAAIDPSRIMTRGLGPEVPYDPRDNETGWELNRRVEFKKSILPNGR